ncbi:hypothetical protein, partial [Deinococcus ruber]|uniref:hypothetical protein n=1 Tax=Deinococcus ruber TaxID=1848197 RepID=UPI001E38B0A1
DRHADGMTAAQHANLTNPANVQAFETCVFLSIRAVAGIELCSDLQNTQGSDLLLCEYAAELERHAQMVAHLDGNGGTDVQLSGQQWYAQLEAAQKSALEIAYESLHAAAYLGLEGGTVSAMMLASAAYALRVLSHRTGERLN